jgi:hypothetical protein
MGTYTWTITPNDIDREIKVWQDRSSGKLRNGWDFLAFNYDSEQIINVLKYAKELNKSVLITSSYLFWKAEVIYDNYGNNNNPNINNNNTYVYITKASNTNNNDNSKITPYEKDEKENYPEKNIEEKPIAVIFSSVDQDIHFPIICYSSDIFSDVVQKLYDEFPKLSKENLYFLLNGDIIKDTSATVEENKIKNGDNILIGFS